MFTYPLIAKDKYWLGYFRADGCISKNGQAIFGQTYFHPVSEFAAYIGKEGRVKSRAQVNGYGFSTSHTVTSVSLAHKLKLIGVKSELNPDLYRSRHFWRGMVDGDGCVAFYPASNRQAISLLVDQKDAEEFQKFLTRELGEPGSIRKTKTDHIFEVRVSGNRAHYLTELLYSEGYSANLRKLAKANSILALGASKHRGAWQPPVPRDEAEYSFAA